MSILLKSRLFHQLGVPAPKTPGEYAWRRSPDMFGDEFWLEQRVDETQSRFAWIHHPSEADAPIEIWAFSVGLSESGRAKITASEGFEPPIRTVQRAAEVMKSVSESFGFKLGGAPHPIPEKAPPNRPGRLGAS